MFYSRYTVKLQNSKGGQKWRLKYDLIAWYSNQTYIYFAEHDDNDETVITNRQYNSSPNYTWTGYFEWSDGTRINYISRSGLNIKLYAPIVGCKMVNPMTGSSIISTSTDDYIERGTGPYYGSMYIFYPA